MNVSTLIQVLFNLIKDTERELKRLADFLEIPCTKSTLEDIAKATSFQNMQHHKLDSTKELDGKGFIYRKGNIFYKVHLFCSNLFC